MLTARWEPNVFFTRERSPSPSLRMSRTKRHPRSKKDHDSLCTERSAMALHYYPTDDSHVEDSSDEFARTEGGDSRDKFIELAQAALEEAIQEEDRKGVVREMVEAFIAKTGAPHMVGALSEQLRSQEVIERLAENHAEQRRMSELVTVSMATLKEPLHQDDVSLPPAKYAHEESAFMLVSECLWRLFRLLLLASVVGLICHFMSASPYRDWIL
ncbi:hypothetical protein BDF14DRAFT_1840208 [Spinellus fusiger]|nr:hypothetical protein BDF14DRAFT_1840208 [Spinellus fusiger]